MTNKEQFIKEIEDLMGDGFEFSEGAKVYFEALKTQAPAKEKVELTEKGGQILKFMQDNCDKYNNIFKSKEIAEGLFMTSRSVSGSMKKLITEDFVEKLGTDPVVYGITEKGKSKEI